MFGVVSSVQFKGYGSSVFKELQHLQYRCAGNEDYSPIIWKHHAHILIIQLCILFLFVKLNIHCIQG